MKKTILKFGLISGGISSALMMATVPFTDKLAHGKYAYLLGYTAIVLSFLLVFFGIKSYRDKECGGEIGFGTAFGVGISITLISCVFYVVTWEIVYFNFMHDFMANYGAHIIERLKASGASAAQIQKQIEENKRFQTMYDNPLFNAAMTFIEPFPVGLVMTLLSAGVLRKKRPGGAAEDALPASS